MRKTAAEVAEMSARNKVAWYKPGKGFGEVIKDAPKTRQKAARAIRDYGPTEHEEQTQVIAWWACNAESYGYQPELLLAIPNGSHKSMAQAAKFRREGLRAGAPDLFLAVQKRALGGLWIEMKRASWKAPLRESHVKTYQKYKRQIDFHEMLRDQNYRVVICAGHNAAINELKEYLK